MNEIIKVNYDNEQPTVSARELHKGVGSTERFSAWFNRQLQFGFIENEDYTTVKVLTEVQNNGGIQERELVDHNLSVDMAKQICMVQKNERARAVRQYLIDLEKAWNTPEQVMARALKMADVTIKKLKLKNTELIIDNKRLDIDNKALAGEILDWADRDRINAGIRKLASATNKNIGTLWNELYKDLQYKYKIYLKSRKERDKDSKPKTSYLNYVRDNEWAKVLKVFCAMCKSYDKSPKEMMQLVTAKDNLSDSGTSNDTDNNKDDMSWLNQL